MISNGTAVGPVLDTIIPSICMISMYVMAERTLMEMYDNIQLFFKQYILGWQLFYWLIVQLVIAGDKDRLEKLTHLNEFFLPDNVFL